MTQKIPHKTGSFLSPGDDCHVTQHSPGIHELDDGYAVGRLSIQNGNPGGSVPNDNHRVLIVGDDHGEAEAITKLELEVGFPSPATAYATRCIRKDLQNPGIRLSAQTATLPLPEAPG